MIECYMCNKNCDKDYVFIYIHLAKPPEKQHSCVVCEDCYFKIQICFELELGIFLDKRGKENTRPSHFTLNKETPLYSGLVFAGIGNPPVMGVNLKTGNILSILKQKRKGQKKLCVENEQ